MTQPLFFEPLLAERIWGGQKLKSHLHKSFKSDLLIGESWELSSVEGLSSPVKINALTPSSLSTSPQEQREVNKSLRQLSEPDPQGSSQTSPFPDSSTLSQYLRTLLTQPGLEIPTLNQLCKTFPQDLLGTQFSGTDFPLLVKLIDAQDKLSVQVHPGDNNPLGPAKSEAWYIIDAPPEAFLYVGIASGFSPEQVLERIKSGKTQDILAKIPVQSGDVIYIPGRTLHAITEGMLIYEIQQTSDCTFRVYDWDRLDNQGKPRKLHISEAMATLNCEPGGPYLQKPQPLTWKDQSWICLPKESTQTENPGTYTNTLGFTPDSCVQAQRLLHTPYFILDQFFVTTSPLPLPTQNCFQILTNLGPAVSIHAGPHTYILPFGQTCLLPACLTQIHLQLAPSATPNPSLPLRPQGLLRATLPVA